MRHSLSKVTRRDFTFDEEFYFKGLFQCLNKLPGVRLMRHFFKVCMEGHILPLFIEDRTNES